MLQDVRHSGYTQFTWFPFPSASEWAREWVRGKISIAGSNMIHCTVIRDSVKWKGKICSLARSPTEKHKYYLNVIRLTVVTEASESMCTVHSLLLLYFHPEKRRRGETRTAKLKVTAEESVPFRSHSQNEKGSPPRNKSDINSCGRIPAMIKWDNLYIIYDELVDWKRSALSLLLGLGGRSYRSTDQ